MIFMMGFLCRGRFVNLAFSVFSLDTSILVFQTTIDLGSRERLFAQGPAMALVETPIVRAAVKTVVRICWLRGTA